MNEEIIETVIEKGKCVECGSKLGYIRIKTNEFKCRSCGHLTPQEKN